MSGVGSEVILRNKLGESVYQLLWDRILDRRLHPGEKLSDLHLSDELGVSRTPVREALNRLLQDGIVQAEPHRGFYVASFSTQDIEEIYELRAALEAAALRASAPFLDTTLLHHALAELTGVERQYAEAGSEEESLAAAAAFLECDREFHRALVERAGNSRLTAAVEGLWAQISVFQKAGTHRRDWVEMAIAHHRAIIAALLAGDVERAADELNNHIELVKRRVIVDLGPEHGEGKGEPR
ncbi:MAG: GntR family transcriptional regulator [Thermomicrobiales bacterium]